MLRPRQSEIENERREYARKQLEQLQKLTESWFDRTAKTFNYLLIGNVGALLIFLSVFREDDKRKILPDLTITAALFALGATVALAGFLFSWNYFNMRKRVTEILIAKNYPESELEAFYNKVRDASWKSESRTKDAVIEVCAQLSFFILFGGGAYVIGFLSGFLRKNI